MKRGEREFLERFNLLASDDLELDELDELDHDRLVDEYKAAARGRPVLLDPDPDTSTVPLLVDEADADAVRTFLAGYLLGAVIRGGLPLEVAVEAHVAGDRFLPSFEVSLGVHAFVVHVDRVIA